MGGKEKQGGPVLVGEGPEIGAEDQDGEDQPEQEQPPGPPPLTIQACVDILANAASNPLHVEGTQTRVIAAAALLEWEAHNQRMALAMGNLQGTQRIVRPT